MASIFIVIRREGFSAKLSVTMQQKLHSLLKERSPGVVQVYSYEQLLAYVVGKDTYVASEGGKLVISDGMPSHPSFSPTFFSSSESSIHTDNLHSLDGGFAMCVYQQAHNQLLLLRDRFGSKPLYWYENEDYIFVASECKFFSAVCDEVSLDPHALKESVLCRWIVEEKHILSPFKQVQAAAYTYFDKGCFAYSKRYWKLNFVPEIIENKTFNHYRDETIAAMRQAIVQIANGRRKVAVLLSGGIDSSVIAAICREVVNECICYTGRIPGSDNVELERALSVANHLGVECRVVDIRAPFNISDLRGMVRRIEEIPRNPNNFVLQQLFEAISKDTDIVLNGDGAEVLFGLADTIRTDKFRRKQQLSRALPKSLQFIIAGILQKTNSSVAHRLASILQYTPSEYAARFDSIVFSLPNRRIINKVFPNDNSVYPLEIFNEYDNFDDALQAYQAYTFLSSSMIRHDRLAQPYGLVSVSPFLMGEVVDVATKLPREFRYTTSSKPVLRAICDVYLPSHVAKWSKYGFDVPWKSWLKSLDIPTKELEYSTSILPNIYHEGTTDYEALWTMITLGILMEMYNVRKHNKSGRA